MKKGIIYFSFLCCLSAICQDATISALSSKELEATIADLQNQIKLNNKDGLAYLKLANAYALQDDVEEKVIIKNFDKSKRYLAGAAREELFLDYSYFLYDHKKNYKLLTIAKTGVREFPNSIELRFLLVRTLNELQSFDFAEKHLKTILHQDFHFAEGHIELALMNEGFASSRYLLALLRYFSLHHYTGEDTELWENWMNVLFYKNDEHSIEGAPYLFSKIHFDRKMFYDTLKDNNSVTTAKKIYTQILFILQYYQKNKRLMSDLDNMYLYYFSKAEENNHLFTLIVLGVLQDTAEGQEWISQNQEKIDSFHTWDDDFSFKK